MSALARTSERDGRTRTTNENCTANESWTRTKYSYDSFGKQTSTSGSISNPFQYTAREFDSETGLYYYRARYYDPNSGRFLSEDPVRTVNLYEYVKSNPTNLSDPFGREPTIPWDAMARRQCTPGEFARCSETCGEQGVQHCWITMHLAVVGLTKAGKPKYDYVDGPMDCSCNPRDDDPKGGPILCPKRYREPFRMPKPTPQAASNAITGLAIVAALVIFIIAELSGN
jgi:RHS repeat-associated protein